MNEIEKVREEFKNKKYLYLKNAVPKKICYFLTSSLLLNSRINNKGDHQVPNAKTIISHELMFDTLLELVWPMLEETINEKLIPTYSYARLYQNGNILNKHSDRESCEISVTIQLGRSHHYSWPIFMGGNRVDLAEGDAVVYKGIEIEHWREECKGPNNYYSGQVFLHYVRENGQYKNHALDKRWEKNPFSRNDNNLMLNK
jgi:hypothetical protein